jgi:predicted 2-oxoglutarate/Fe(II)-dependent dioxygenase YbiX
MYEIVRVLEKEYLDELLWMYETKLLAEKPAVVATTSNSKNGRINYSERKTTRLEMHPRLYPELCESLESYVGDDTKANQFDYLVYNVGDFFLKHTDDTRHSFNRVWSTITLLDRSNDLEGGELVIYNGEEKEIVNLKVGETIIFKSYIEHEVLPVIKGTRKVLVIWLGNT